MDKQQEQLETLKEIRVLMERSSRFISLSGFSGVIAGVMALAGVVAVYWRFGFLFSDEGYYKLAILSNGEQNLLFYQFIITDAAIVLLVSLIAARILTIKKAKKHGVPVWDITAKRLLINMLIPLIAGGIYCVILFCHNAIAFIAPSTLIFYGMALLNAGKYTLNDVRYLGVVQLIIGLIAIAEIEHGLLFWALGFGVVHIVYGITMYYKYER